MPHNKDTRVENSSYLAWIRSQPCCVCKTNLTIDAHHPRIDVVGLGTKVSDRWAVPLCRRHHDELHGMGNEREFWASCHLDPTALAMKYQVMVQR